MGEVKEFCPFTKGPCGPMCALNVGESCAFAIIAERVQNIDDELEDVMNSLDSLSSSGIQVHTDD